MTPDRDLSGTCLATDLFNRQKAYTLALDAEGRVLGADSRVSASHEFRDLLGADLSALLASDPCRARGIPAEAIDGLRRVVSGREGFFAHEYVCSSPPPTRRIRVSAVRLEGADPVRSLFTHSDLTEADRKEEALRLPQFAMDHSADAIFWVEKSGRFVYVNEAASRLTGYSRDALMSMSVPDFDDAIAEKGWAAEWEELTSKGSLRVNTEIRRQDGRRVPIELTADYVRFGDRELSCAYLRDISERRKLEEQFFQAQKLEAVARLAGGVAHDFNNLLTVINGYSNMLLEQSIGTDPLRELYQEIHDAGRRAANLTRRLLAFSRKEVIQPVVLDLNLLLREFDRMLRRLLGEDIRILMDLAPDLGRIKADPGQMEQVIMNLCVNARDAMPGGGNLVVQTSPFEVEDGNPIRTGSLSPGRYVRLVVADTGCGMDKAVLSRLFEPFFTTKERGRGTGLGLSTVYGIVQGYGGTIEVDSEKGRGTSFSLYFPVTEERAETAHLEPRAARGRETILLLEDERPVRLVVRRLLESHGYRVLEALSEQEALDIGTNLSRPIDLLLTDMVLPTLGGAEVARRLRQARPSLRVLFMSGYTDRSPVQGGVLPPGTGFLQKPFALDAVTRKVRETLESRVLEEVVR